MKAARPAQDRLRRAIRQGKVEWVCYKLDRLGRSLTHLALILDEMSMLHKLQVPLICCSQGIDTSGDSPTGKLQLGLQMAVAEFERSIIRERVNAGLKAAKMRGVRLGRPGTLMRQRQEVWQLREQGCGPREISRRLAMPIASVCKVLKVSTSS